MSNHLFDSLIAAQADSSAAFMVQDGAENLSFSEFLSMSARLAHVLVKQGLTPDDRVVVQCEKSLEMVVLYAATIQAGGVFLPLNTAYTPEEVGYFVTDAAPSIIVCDESSLESFGAMAENIAATVLSLNADGSGSLTADMSKQNGVFDTVPRGPDDLAALLYTSGTTGRSKGAMLTHDNLLSNALTLVEHWRISNEDRLIHALPIFHTHGLFVALNTALLAGVTVYWMQKFDLDAIVAALPTATLLMGVPTFYTRLLADERLTEEQVSSMRLFISGSAPLLAETHAAFTKCTGHAILERYGMTETNMITSNPYEGERRAGTVGQALAGVEVRITNPETGSVIEDGGVGMIEVRGPNVFKGYWQMPEKTAEELQENGFFITGDLGQYSDDGYLSIVGRAKDLIITGGFNVYPKEIEDVLNDIEGVSESAVFGIPHPDFGEAIIAAVVLDKKTVLDTDALNEVVSNRLARFKHPQRYEFLSELPRNTMGKVQKNVLRATFGNAP